MIIGGALLLLAALAQGADTLVTIGGVQSNHTRQVAAVAAKLGMKCHLVQESWVDWPDPVNDKVGNPIEIAAVVVWRVENTAQAAPIPPQNPRVNSITFHQLKSIPVEAPAVCRKLPRAKPNPEPRAL